MLTAAASFLKASLLLFIAPGATALTPAFALARAALVRAALVPPYARGAALVPPYARAAAPARRAPACRAAVMPMGVGDEARRTGWREITNLLDSAACATAGPGTFANVHALEAALHAHAVDTSDWGSGRFKSAAMLFDELERGETVLRFIAGATVRRWVNVVKVRVRRGDDTLQLIEASQVLPNGKVRTRGMPLSEKMLYREAPLAAAWRGIAEELGLTGAAEGVTVEVDAASLTQWRERCVSRSFPSLLSNYNLHQFDAVVSGLPEGSFYTSEPAGIRPGGKLLHRWEWRPPSNRAGFYDLAEVMWS